MESFLSTTVDDLKANKYGDLHIVLGNESCDLDSAVSALVYAAFLHWQHLQIKCKVCTRLKRDESQYKDDLFVPILNVAREDYELKTEVTYCLREHGIDASKLVFKNDLDLRQLCSKPKTAVTLVDHHVLAKTDEHLTDLVTEIIDHRPIDRSNWRYQEDTRTSIEVVGSCASLVAQRIRSLSILVAKESDFFNAYPKAADLLRCAIILDTVNFSKEVNKATQVDRDMGAYLESVLKIRNSEEDRKAKLDQLVSARMDVSTLSAAQLLRKDVKITGEMLVPSFPILIKDFLQRPNALKAVSEALSTNSCTIALLLGMSLTDGLRRDVAVYANNNDVVVQFAKFLTEWKGPPLQLQAEEFPNIKNCLYFKQNNLSASRKQYMPAVMKFLEIVKKK